MAAPTEVYVDPAINGNSGTGTAIDPYGDLQYALNTKARDATNGDRFNVKAGTAEILAATLSLATYGAPTEAAPLIIQGYTSAAGDGGIGEIDGDDTYGCFAGTEDYLHVRHMHIRDGGASTLINLDVGATVTECEIHGTTGDGIVVGANGIITRNNIHNVGDYGVTTGQGGYVAHNYFANGVNEFIRCIFSSLPNVVAERNIIVLSGASLGIVFGGDACHAINNTILAVSCTGSGIYFSTAAKYNRIIENNYIEGFSGAGGEGIDFNSCAENGTIYRNNAFFNNTANESNKVAGECLVDADNQSLGATGLAKSGANTFANRFTYFAPKVILHGDAYPAGANLDIGAVQHANPVIPDAANVWKTGVSQYGYADSLISPTKTAASIVVTGGAGATLAETEIADGVIVDPGADQITGTHAGGGYTYGDEDPTEVLTTADGAGTYHAPDAAEVISTAVFGPASGTAGTYDVSNVAAGNIKDGVSIGGVEGNYDPMAAAVFPAEANVSTVESAYGPTGAEYAGELDLSLYTLTSTVVSTIDAAKADILDTRTLYTVTGTFDESARNTDPGVGNVRDGTTYMILGVSKEGTLEVTGSGGGVIIQKVLPIIMRKR